MRDVELTSYQWKNRLLLVFAQDSSDPSSRKQRSLLAQQEAELADRDLLVLWLYDQASGRPADRPIQPETTRRLREELDVPKGGFHVLLIGKDGGVKLRSEAPVQPAHLYKTIDAMPMRQAEMRRKAR